MVIVQANYSNHIRDISNPGPRVKGEKIRLDDIIHGKFKPNPFNATWNSGKLNIKYSVLVLQFSFPETKQY